MKNFLFLLPQKTAVKDFADVLDFMKKEQIELWTDFNLMEITLENGTFLLEDLQDSLKDSDREQLAGLSMVQIFACDYEEADYREVQQIMQRLTDKFEGKLASDTEDFMPLLRVKEL